MLDPRIPFKNRQLAGVLAFLVPGLGHLYQGRQFKGILCGFCILSTFFMGQCLGDWSVVYWKKDPTNLLNPYYAQVFVGLPALPALMQARRYHSADNVDLMTIDSKLTKTFEGALNVQDRSSQLTSGDVAGTLSIEPDTNRASSQGARGEFSGTLTARDGTVKELKSLKIAGTVLLDKPVSGSPDRTISVQVVEPDGNAEQRVGSLSGSIPRRFLDWYEAPPEEDAQLALHRQLGKFHELALTFTMLAGLLNILVILDAVEGPAYGYGDVLPTPGTVPSNAPAAVVAAPAGGAVPSVGLIPVDPAKTSAKPG